VNGIALYNEKNPLLADMIFKIINRAVPFSDPIGIELGVEIVSSDLKIILSVIYNHITYKVSTNLFGKYNLENVKAAIATGLFFGVEMKDIVEAVENYHPSNNRSQIKITKNNTLICDSYNANPTSMLSALESFVAIQADKKLVILGDMLELGSKSEEEHIRVLNEMQTYKIDKVFLVGPLFQKASYKFGLKSFPDVDALMKFLTGDTVKGNTILIKGSRGIGLEKIYNLL